MRFSSLVLGLAALPNASAWGGFGHITIAYLASDFVANETATYLQSLLRDDSPDYLASVATWADSVRYTRWGRFTGPFHFIDAKDDPPRSCGVDLARDCKPEGCVVTALANYTAQLLSGPAAAGGLPPLELSQAAKFIVHFVGDIHQPLHDEDVARGGNGIRVRFDGHEMNLHHVWDTSIAEKMVGGVRRRPYEEARAWADDLSRGITEGKFRYLSESWLAGMDLGDMEGTALKWAREGNSYVCSTAVLTAVTPWPAGHDPAARTVFPEGPDAIVGQELGSGYFKNAAPVVEIQVARAGYRLAAWLDLVVSHIASPKPTSDDL